MISLVARLLTLLVALGSVRGESGCQTRTIRSSPPNNIKGDEVALRDYSYCAGTLNATAYVANITADRQVVYLWYTNGNNESTPLAGVSLSLLSAVGDDGEWEIWGASTPGVGVYGITELRNLTYEAGGIGEVYQQVLNSPVEGGDNGGMKGVTAIPKPYAMPRGLGDDITDFLAPHNGSQAAISLQKMFLNINPDIEGSPNGVVVAGRSGPSFAEKEPNYEYVWPRDTSLAMDVVQRLHAAASKSEAKAKYEKVLFQYAAARAQQQTDPNLDAGTGHARFWMNNTAWYDPRSQNDGPATAAAALIGFAEGYLAAGGDAQTVKEKVYDSTRYPDVAPLKKDLLFTANNWSSPTVDIWEGVVGDHFYDRMVQRRALVMGQSFARKLGDTETAEILSTAVNALTKSLVPFWDPARQILLYEYGPVLRNESSYRDVATVLGINHGQAVDGFYSLTDDKVLSTVLRIATMWTDIYPLANTTEDSAGKTLGIPIGRFPEDMYNGTATGPGNPWFMATAAYAEFMYRLTSSYTTAGYICVTNVSKPFFTYFAPSANLLSGCKYTSQRPGFHETISSLKGWGDAFMRRIKASTPADGNLREQYDRVNGEAVGVADLTWSYASLLSAAFARAEVTGSERYTTEMANRGFARN